MDRRSAGAAGDVDAGPPEVVAHGAAIRVESHHGWIEGVAELTRAVKPGHLFLPFAYWEAAANRLTGSALDPFGKIPGFKVTAVRAFAVSA